MPKTIRVLLVPDDVSEPVAEREIVSDLDHLKEAIGGGYLELVAGRGWHAYCDEDGRMKRLPVNERATGLANSLGWPLGDFLSGPVLFLGTGDEEGEETSVEPDVLLAAAMLGLLDSGLD